MRNISLSLLFFTVGLLIGCQKQPEKIAISSNLYPSQPNAHGFAITTAVEKRKVQQRFGAFAIKQFPRHFKYADTLSFVQYFTGTPGLYPDGFTVLMGIPKQGLPHLYPDFNNNGNFRDDGTTLKFNHDSTLFMNIPVARTKSANSGAQFQIIKAGANSSRLEKMLGTDVLRQRGIPVMPYKDWLKVKRYNLRRDTLPLDGEQVAIAVCDYNFNGVFNDINADRWFLKPLGTPYSFKPANGMLTLKNDSNFQRVKSRHYELEYLSADGRTLQLSPKTGYKSDHLENGALLTPFHYRDLDSNLHKITEHSGKGKYLLLDFWGTWCAGCRMAVDQLKSLATNHDQNLTILALNSGEPTDVIEQFNTRQEIHWPQGYLNARIRKQLKVHTYPRYILINPNGRIVAMDISLREVSEVLQNP